VRDHDAAISLGEKACSPLEQFMGQEGGMTMVTEQDLQQIRQALELERERLLHRATDPETLTLGMENPDENDLADQYGSQEIQSTLDDLSLQKLDRILRALERLNKGTFGVCLKCHQAIPAERLLALPYAELCVDCQEKLEGKGKRA